MTEARLATIADLRARFAAPRVQLGRLPTGLPDLDGWLGGWPSPGLTELVGAPGSGRLAPILPAIRALLRRGRTVVWVDPLRQLHPPGLDAELGGLVILRPPGDQAAWAAEQVARSGAVDALVMMDLPRLGRAGLRLGRACESGSTAVFVVGEEAEPDLPAALRLRAEGWSDAGLRLTCTRAREGRAVGTRVVQVGEGSVSGRRAAPLSAVELAIGGLEQRVLQGPPPRAPLAEPAPAASARPMVPPAPTTAPAPTVAHPPTPTTAPTPTVAHTSAPALAEAPAPWSLRLLPEAALPRAPEKARAASAKRRSPRHRPQLRLVAG